MQLHSSLLHRLIDPEPQQPESGQRNYIDYAALQEEIRTHLESLLNTRLNFFNLDSQLTELTRSIFTYGIPDFSRHHYSIKKNQILLCDMIQRTIAYFEPRLQDVRVSLLDEVSQAERALVIRITGTIVTQDKPAIFESSLNAMSYQFAVKEKLA